MLGRRRKRRATSASNMTDAASKDLSKLGRALTVEWNFVNVSSLAKLIPKQITSRIEKNNSQFLSKFGMKGENYFNVTIRR